MPCDMKALLSYIGPDRRSVSNAVRRSVGEAAAIDGARRIELETQDTRPRKLGCDSRMEAALDPAVAGSALPHLLTTPGSGEIRLG